MKKILLFLTFLTLLTPGFAKTKFIPASDKNFRYVGRCDRSKLEEVRFDWSGFYIQFNFTGSECKLRMSDTGHNYYNVFVDNQPAKVIDVKSDTTIVVARGLTGKSHRLQLYKRTEGNQGTGLFKGVELSETGELLPWTDIPERKIEFIGNSITCGYGVEGKRPDERWTPQTENNYLSYGPIMARAFGADYHITAHSGLGVVRNYGYREKISPQAMPDRFNRVFDEKEEPVWDFSKWKPDVVVINLGTNDFSTPPFPDRNDFEEGYEKLINKIFDAYGEIPVFCIVGPMIDEPCYSYVKEVVGRFRTTYQKQNVYFVGIPGYLMVRDKDLGADSHPNYSGQRKMAAHVLPVISGVMGWSYNNHEFCTDI